MIPGTMSSRTMSFDPIENRRDLKQLGIAIIPLTRGDKMSYQASLNRCCGHEPASATKGFYGMVGEHEYRPGMMAALAPPRRESDPRLVMDRLLRECLKGRSPAE